MRNGFDFDLVVVGGGSAGFAAAIKATEMGARVAIVEGGIIGGTCLNRGCIPSKNLLQAALFYHSVKQEPFPGISLLKGKLNFKQVMAQKDALIESLRQKKYLDILKENKNIKFFRGRGQFVSISRVQVSLQVSQDILQSPKFIIATGSSPSVIPVKGLDSVPYLTSDEALELKEPPRSMIILGGRAVALEFAQMYAHFGTEVTILQRSSRIIPDHEPEISLALEKYLAEEGINIFTDVNVKEVGCNGGNIMVLAESEEETLEFKAERLLVATGRRPNTQDLALKTIGVETDLQGAVKVNDEMQTTAGNVWAAGDVTARTFLVTLAAREGSVAAENALDCCAHRKVDYSCVPHAIFTTPNVATVGLKEEEARSKGLSVKAQTLNFSMVPKAQCIRDTRGLVKMVAEENSHRILGVHILAPEGVEVIHEASLAIKFGLTLEDLIDTIHVYPTMSESLKLTAQSFFKDVKKLSCCAE